MRILGWLGVIAIPVLVVVGVDATGLEPDSGRQLRMPRK